MDEYVVVLARARTVIETCTIVVRADSAVAANTMARWWCEDEQEASQEGASMQTGHDKAVFHDILDPWAESSADGVTSCILASDAKLKQNSN